MLPAILYFPLIGLGWLLIDLFSTEISEEETTTLQTTDYLNSTLPSANVSDEIGGKRQNMTDVFGNISDRSAVQTIESDRDSLLKKEGFDSKYSDEEAARLDSIEALRQAELELREKLAASAAKGDQMASDGFAPEMTEEERAIAAQERVNRMMAEMDRDLANVRQEGAATMNAMAGYQDSISQEFENPGEHAVTALSDGDQAMKVVKAVRDDSYYFNTLSENAPESNMIKAIVDEEVKAVDGSRVRLRILDDVQIGDVSLKKGSYLYAQMSGFGQQRVKGDIKSVMVGDNLLKINLSIYDTDGLEGLYVPQSSFRELAQDVGSSAMQSNMNVTSGMTENNLAQWAGNALQNAYQRTSNAIAKALRKNKVRIKYGTQVYLVNGRD